MRKYQIICYYTSVLSGLRTCVDCAKKEDPTVGQAKLELSKIFTFFNVDSILHTTFNFRQKFVLLSSLNMKEIHGYNN